MRPKLTVIFDRSAFHGAFFDRLATSKLAELAGRGTVCVHHTMVFLEETLSMYGKANNRDELQRQIPFILDICSGKWFNEPTAIWRQELLKKRSRKAVLFVKDSLRKEVERQIQRGVLSAQSWPEYWAAQSTKKVERDKQGKQHEIFAAMRREVAKKLNALPASAKRGQTPWRDIVQRDLDYLGASIIERHLAFKRSARIANAWRQQKDSYPYFTSFVEGMLFAQYYATVEQGKRIDWNAQADIDQLCYLNAADCMVSCDTRFMKDAFDTIWKPRGKLFLTTDAFLDRLKQL